MMKEYIPIKYITDLFSNVCSESEKFSIYSVEGCFKEVSFPGVFTVK